MARWRPLLLRTKARTPAVPRSALELVLDGDHQCGKDAVATALDCGIWLLSDP
jgi:hypothetical protein